MTIYHDDLVTIRQANKIAILRAELHGGTVADSLLAEIDLLNYKLAKAEAKIALLTKTIETFEKNIRSKDVRYL